MSPRDWLAQLDDILDAIQKIGSHIGESDLETFIDNELVLDAVVWNITVIGEASRLIPEHVVREYSDVPWSHMRAMRNLVVHEYFRIDATIVWETATQDLPGLIPRIRQIIAEQESPDQPTYHEPE